MSKYRFRLRSWNELHWSEKLTAVAIAALFLYLTIRESV